MSDTNYYMWATVGLIGLTTIALFAWAITRNTVAGIVAGLLFLSAVGTGIMTYRDPRAMSYVDGPRICTHECPAQCPPGYHSEDCTAHDLDQFCTCAPN